MKKLILITFFALFTFTSFGQRHTIESSPNVGYFMLDSVDYVQGHYEMKYSGKVKIDTLRKFSLQNIYTGKLIINSRYFDQVSGVTSWDELSQLFRDLEVFQATQDVSIQDQHTPIIIAKFNQVTNSTTLTDTTAIDDTYIIVTDTTGVSNSELIIVFSSETGRVYFGSIISKNIDTVFLDTPLDSSFPIGSDVDFALTNMAVDGSSIPQIFGLRGTSEGEPIGEAFDITRIVFKCTTSSAVDLSKFANIDKLINGLLLRKRDGTYQNIFNVKDNGELAGIMFDFTVYAADNPAQGIDGFVGRLTFAGQSKIGVTIRLQAGEDLEFIISDALQAITLLEAVAEGHIVIK